MPNEPQCSSTAACFASGLLFCISSHTFLNVSEGSTAVLSNVIQLPFWLACLQTTAQAEDAEGKVLGAEREEAGEEEASSDTEAWDDSVDEGDSDADLWNSSEEEEDSDADLWGSSEDEEDSDDVFKIVAEADEVCSGEDDETSCEEAEEEERSLNAETDKKVFGCSCQQLEIHGWYSI